MAKDLEISVLLDFYGEMLTEKQRDYLTYYYNDDLSLGEIAQNEFITRQGVRDIIKRAEIQLHSMENSLGLYKKYVELSEGLMEIKKCAEEIAELNRFTGISREIHEKCAHISDIADKFLE